MAYGNARSCVLRIVMVAILAAAVATPAIAKHWTQPQRDIYDDMEDMLRENDSAFRIALLRTYLPMGGRRSVDLPIIQRFKNGNPRRPLKECPTVGNIGSVDYDFSAVYELLKNGEGDHIAFMAEVARAVEIPIKPALKAAFPYCAWWALVDERFFNFIFPDAVATYWFTPFIAPPRDDTATEWHITGDFIQERYKSFALYDHFFNPFDYQIPGGPFVDSTVTDYQMKPHHGLNPFQERDLPLSDYGQYTMVMKSNPTLVDFHRPQSNVVPMWQFPPVIGSDDDRTIPLPLECNREGSAFPCGVAGVFAVPSPEVLVGVVSNVNNIYVASITDQLYVPIIEPRVNGPLALVIRGKVPYTTGSANPPLDVACHLPRNASKDACYCVRNPDGCLPIAWETDSNGDSGPKFPEDQDTIDMRYWSICTAIYNIPYPTIGNIALKNRDRENTGCVPDTDIIRTNKKGQPKANGAWFTVVITTEAGKPKIFKNRWDGVRSRSTGSNWIQGSANFRMLINLRNLFPNYRFNNALQEFEDDSNWVTSFNRMKAYYPVINTLCTVEDLNTKGWGWCVAPGFNDTCGDRQGRGCNGHDIFPDI